MDYFVDLFIFIQLSYFWRAEKFLETVGLWMNLIDLYLLKKIQQTIQYHLNKISLFSM